MEKNSNKPLDDGHDQPPQDEATRNKIDKHLSDESDTISEEDMKNINTSTGTDPDALAKEHLHDKEEADEIIKDHSKDDDEPEKEVPSPWEILGG